MSVGYIDQNSPLHDSQPDERQFGFR